MPRSQDKYRSLDALKKEIVKIIGGYLDLRKYRVFVFGSRADGKNSERSDIDIGIEGLAPVPKEILNKIKEKIGDIETLYQIDIIDFAGASRDFKKVAKKKIEIISSRK